jgi:hypothetical protein
VRTRHQKPLDLAIAAPARMLKRRDAVAIGEIDVGSGLGQETDDLGIWRPPIAQDDRLEQRRPSEPVDVVDIDAGLDQRPYGLDMSALGGRNERGSTETVSALQVRAMREGEAQDVEMTPTGAVPSPIGAGRKLPSYRASPIPPAIGVRSSGPRNGQSTGRWTRPRPGRCCAIKARAR